MEITKEMATVAVGVVGLFKLFEPSINRFFDRFRKQEDSQNTEIESIKKDIEELKRNAATMETQIVTWKEVNKMFMKLEDKFSELQKALAKIEGKLEIKESVK